MGIKPVETLMTCFYQIKKYCLGYPEIEEICDLAIERLKAIKEEQDAIPLKPCPFCGGKAKIIQDDRLYFYKVRCVKCYAETSHTEGRNIAVKEWNRRANNEPAN